MWAQVDHTFHSKFKEHSKMRLSNVLSELINKHIGNSSFKVFVLIV